MMSFSSGTKAPTATATTVPECTEHAAGNASVNLQRAYCEGFHILSIKSFNPIFKKMQQLSRIHLLWTKLLNIRIV